MRQAIQHRSFQEDPRHLVSGSPPGSARRAVRQWSWCASRTTTDALATSRAGWPSGGGRRGGEPRGKEGKHRGGGEGRGRAREELVGFSHLLIPSRQGYRLTGVGRAVGLVLSLKSARYAPVWHGGSVLGAWKLYRCRLNTYKGISIRKVFCHRDMKFV